MMSPPTMTTMVSSMLPATAMMATQGILLRSPTRWGKREDMANEGRWTGELQGSRAASAGVARRKWASTTAPKAAVADTVKASAVASFKSWSGMLTARQPKAVPAVLKRTATDGGSRLFIRGSMERTARGGDGIDGSRVSVASEAFGFR